MESKFFIDNASMGWPEFDNAADAVECSRRIGGQVLINSRIWSEALVSELEAAEQKVFEDALGKVLGR